mgnify:CR=1 FL=1
MSSKFNKHSCIALAAMALAGGAHAVDFDGYFRAGPGATIIPAHATWGGDRCARVDRCGQLDHGDRYGRIDPL